MDMPHVQRHHLRIRHPRRLSSTRRPRVQTLTTMAAIWSLVVSGVIGSGITYLFSWVRESRRTKDAYRTPQRVAIGDIVEATYELTLRIHAVRDVFEESATGLRDVPDAELNEVYSQMSRALFGVGRAFHIGRLTVVDAECYEAMGEAFNNFAMLQRDLQNVADIEPTADNMREKVKSMVSRIRGLNEDVFALVQAGQKSLSPVQTWRNRRKRKDVRERLEAKHFGSVGDLGARF